ncbi:MAG: tetratricopeptide repeat protein, partial [Planctomycetaceae bacterium]|nr:tetratricopeptide repeat protein [Planctomycetaceae bacterium]
GLAGTQTSLLEWESLLATLTQLKALDSENQQLPRVAVAAGDAAYDAQLWDVADQIYAFVQSLPEDHPFAIPARSGAAHTTYELGRFEKSAELFQAIGRTPGIDLELRSHCAYMVALSLRQAGRLDESLEQFEITAKAFQRESAPETNEQLAACRNAYRSAKGGARVARELMKTEQADRLYESAFQQLKLLPAKEQKELDLLINEWADLSYNAKDFSRSDELYRLLLKERPDSDLADEARLILAESLRFDGNLTAAQDEFQKLFLDPRSDEFVRQRAVVHLLDLLAESKDWGASLELSEKVLGEFPQSEHRLYTEYRRGEALLQLKKTDEAIQQLTRLKEALANDLGSAPAWWPETWLLLAEAQFLKKDYSSMDETLGDLNVLGDGLPVLYRAEALRGRSLESRARFDEAREAYQRVIDSPAGKGTETAAEAQFRIAESYLKQNNLPTALKEYIKVFVGYDAPRFQSAALYQAGSVDATLKNWREAATTFRTLIEKFPESDFATQAQSELEKIETAFPELKMES